LRVRAGVGAVAESRSMYFIGVPPQASCSP
jgi:hypothetical protein